MADRSVAIVGGRIVPITGEPVDGGTVLVQDGKVTAVGGDVAIPDGVRVIDAAGSWVLPGFIEAHGHVGVHEEAEGWAGSDTNEMTDPVTAQVRAIDAINPADLGFRDAIAGGVLAVNVNPGSGNPIGGQTVALKCWGRTVDEMVLREPSGLKSALGENPKRVYGERQKTPSTRLGTAAVIRGAFVDAANYLQRLDNEQRKPEDQRKPVDRDLKLEALGKVLRREIPWRQHCHRADDIGTAIRIAEEFGYDLVIDHGTEAHLLADIIAAKGIPVIIGPLLTSRSKVELRNRSLANPGLLARPVGQGRPRPRDRAARADHQPGAHRRHRRPARLHRGRQGRRPGDLVGRSARRAQPGRACPDRRRAGVRLLRRRGQLRGPVTPRAGGKRPGRVRHE